jgi:hypothetical protein
MSFNRLPYDNCAYAKQLQESVSPMEYSLFKGKYENCKQCPVGSYTNILDFTVRANVESELYGLTRPGTRCPDKLYNPAKPGATGDLTAARACDTIYYITPTNMKMPTTNGFSENALGKNMCS